jgi:hypothetical protein
MEYMKMLISIIICIIFLTGCSNAGPETSISSDQIKFDEIVYDENFDFAYSDTNLIDLENRADYIVKAVVKSGSENILRYVPSQESRQPYSGNNITPLLIKEVYKGDLKSGDEIRVVEPYFYFEHLGKQYLRTMYNYMPSNVEGEYIFFLTSPFDSSTHPEYNGVYWLTELEKSRYPLFDASSAGVESFSNAELSLGELATEGYQAYHEEYMDIYAEVADKWF